MPKFVIGIGSQRAGSTLLHKILDECTSIFMHPVKELHYYDTLYGVRSESVLIEYSKRQVYREVEKLISVEEYRYIDKRYKCYIRTNNILANKKISDVDYMDLYRPCILGSDYLGEITPEYMILPEEGVKKMSSVIGRDAKIILISRDPVDRFISAFKLLKVYRGEAYEKDDVSNKIEEVLESMPEWIAQQAALNDYDLAIEKYCKYFDSLLVLSYEDIVSDSSLFIEKLKNFLGVSVDEKKAKEIMGERVNSIGETGEVSERVKEIIQKKLNCQVS